MLLFTFFLFASAQVYPVAITSTAKNRKRASACKVTTKRAKIVYDCAVLYGLYVINKKKMDQQGFGNLQFLKKLS